MVDAAAIAVVMPLQWSLIKPVYCCCNCECKWQFKTLGVFDMLCLFRIMVDLTKLPVPPWVCRSMKLESVAWSFCKLTVTDSNFTKLVVSPNMRVFIFCLSKLDLFCFVFVFYLIWLFILDPQAEVIALSPKTLMATNRFICEICNKGFQRDQNLQLHKRGHNLPWKLKQRTSNEIRKKVYVCPEPTCVHHDPSRALGDLTGIKKHFCRKHGEKKWKCDKCSKKYAVQSDWKAHSKTCGTREYRCDCGTLFSRYN